VTVNIVILQVPNTHVPFKMKATTEKKAKIKTGRREMTDTEKGKIIAFFWVF